MASTIQHCHLLYATHIIIVRKGSHYDTTFISVNLTRHFIGLFTLIFMLTKEIELHVISFIQIASYYYCIMIIVFNPPHPTCTKQA